MEGQKALKHFRKARNMQSQWEIVKHLLHDPKVNWIKIDYAGHAKAAIESWFRSQTGETVDHVKKAAIFANRMTSSRSTSLLFTMARDAGSRNENKEFDYRSLILASLDPETLKPQENIPYIMVANDFQTYHKVNLSGLPIFPELTDVKQFTKDLVELRRLEALKEKMKNRLASLKKALDKGGVCEQDDCEETYRITWKDSESESNVVLNSKGEEIKQTATKSFGFQLHPTELPSINFIGSNYTLDNIVSLWNAIEGLSTKIEAFKDLRAYELGVMERLTDPFSPFMVGGVEFSVKKIPTSNYDWTPADKAKIKSGEYKIATVKKTSGRWKCEKA